MREFTKNCSDYNVTYHKWYLKSKAGWAYIGKRAENKILGDVHSYKVDRTELEIGSD